MSDRPLSERVLDVSEMWHYTTCVTDTAPDAECDCVISNLADEIAALEDEIKALCTHRDSLEAERDRTAAALWRITCQCGNVELDIHHHAPKCPFRAALEEGGGE